MITKEEFRAEAAAFLEAHAKRRVKASQGWGEGSDEVGILPERTPEEDVAILAEAKQWRAKVFDAGFGWITGPQAYGGRGLPREYDRIWQSLENDYDVPGIPEAMRAAGRAITPLADLSRGTAGVVGRTLVINLPGSPKAAAESLDAVAPLLHHAIETLAGPFDHGKRGEEAP